VSQIAIVLVQYPTFMTAKRSMIDKGGAVLLEGGSGMKRYLFFEIRPNTRKENA